MAAENSDTFIDVAKVCELAHFDLPQEEMDKFQGQLNTILGYWQKLHELDIDALSRRFMPAKRECVRET